MRGAWLTGALLALAAGPLPAQTYLLVVTGVGGEPQYTRLLTQWGRTAVEAARARLGVPDSNVVFLAEVPERDPERVNGPATKERLAAAVRSIAERAGPEAVVIILLFGHGSDRGDEPRFNLVGPDITAVELAGLLSSLHGRVVVVNTASASGGFVPALAGPGRVIVTATKSGFERNWTRFGEFFVQAADIAESADGADTDKDGRVSVLEAFVYAKREVARAYEKENRLLTEHAVLGGDSVLASSVFLGSATAAVAARTADPETKRLYARRDSLERRVAELRGAQSSMAADVYERELENVLVELATTRRAIREREGVKRP